MLLQQTIKRMIDLGDDAYLQSKKDHVIYPNHRFVRETASLSS